MTSVHDNRITLGALRATTLVGLTAFALAAVSCAGSRPSAEPIQLDDEDGETEPLHRIVQGDGDPSLGRDLYVRYCQPCHGADGKGDGPASQAMEPKPRDFTSGHFKFASTIAGLPPTDGDLYRTVAQGVPGTAMPAWGEQFDESEIWSLVAYVKTFSDTFETPIPTSQITKFSEEPPADEASLKAGRELYEQRCATCHGKQGRGDGPGAAGLKDYRGQDVSPRDFTSEPFKSGGRSRDIYRTISNGLEGTPMAPHGPGLKSDQIWHLVHYVESLREPLTIWQYLFGDEPARKLIRDYR